MSVARCPSSAGCVSAAYDSVSASMVWGGGPDALSDILATRRSDLVGDWA